MLLHCTKRNIELDCIINIDPSNNNNYNILIYCDKYAYVTA